MIFKAIFALILFFSTSEIILSGSSKTLGHIRISERLCKRFQEKKTRVRPILSSFCERKLAKAARRDKEKTALREYDRRRLEEIEDTKNEDIL